MAVHIQFKTPLGRFKFSMYTMWNLARAKPLEPLVRVPLNKPKLFEYGRKCMNQKVNRRRSNSITIRFDDSEKREWLKYCDSLREPQFGSYADVILHLIRSNTTIQIDLKSLRDNTIALNKIGANLNQIAKACNSGKQLDAGSYVCFKESLNVLKINKDNLNNIWQLLRQ